MPEQLQGLVTFTAGTGMRQGEVLGLTLDRIDFLRREVRGGPSARHSPEQAY
jgi:integrase